MTYKDRFGRIRVLLPKPSFFSEHNEPAMRDQQPFERDVYLLVHDFVSFVVMNSSPRTTKGVFFCLS